MSIRKPSITKPSLEEMVHNSSPPEWVREMHSHYVSTGSFRTGDILRVLGNPREGVDMGTEEQMRSLLLSHG